LSWTAFIDTSKHSREQLLGDHRGALVYRVVLNDPLICEDLSEEELTELGTIGEEIVVGIIWLASVLDRVSSEDLKHSHLDLDNLTGNLSQVGSILVVCRGAVVLHSVLREIVGIVKNRSIYLSEFRVGNLNNFLVGTLEGELIVVLSGVLDRGYNLLHLGLSDHRAGSHIIELKAPSEENLLGKKLVLAVSVNQPVSEGSKEIHVHGFRRGGVCEVAREVPSDLLVHELDDVRIDSRSHEWNGLNDVPLSTHVLENCVDVLNESVELPGVLPHLFWLEVSSPFVDFNKLIDLGGEGGGWDSSGPQFGLEAIKESVSVDSVGFKGDGERVGSVL